MTEQQKETIRQIRALVKPSMDITNVQDKIAALCDTLLNPVIIASPFQVGDKPEEPQPYTVTTTKDTPVVTFCMKCKKEVEDSHGCAGIVGDR